MQPSRGSQAVGLGLQFFSSSTLGHRCASPGTSWRLLGPSRVNNLQHHQSCTTLTLVASTTYRTRAFLFISCNDIRRRLTPRMASLSQKRQHGGHSHAGHHHHDNTYLVSTNKKDAGVRITRIGLYVNFFMAIGKGLGGYFLNSQALVADAFHSLTDLVSDFLTLATVSWSLKPPTARFPGGYGKIESLGSLGVSSLLLAGGLGLGWHSVEILYSQFFFDAAASAGDHAHEHSHSHGGSMFGHSHSHNPADMGIPNLHAAWIAGGSIIVKEYLYRASTSTC
jgi:hypothetical protein